MSFDPIPVADEVCEILFQGDPQKESGRLVGLLRSAAGGIDGVLAEVERRGALDRLLPAAPSDSAATLLDALISGVTGVEGFLLLARGFIDGGGDYDRVGINHLIDRANDLKLLPVVFADLVRGGDYDALIALMTSDHASDTPMLRALAAARPTWNRDALNPKATALLGNRAAWQGARRFEYDLIIVPGFTPVAAAQSIALSELPAAGTRVELALSDFKAGRAPFFCLTGSAVHPPGTPENEALMMREELLKKGVPEERILVDPYARHTTTNVRNAGRFMLQFGLSKGLIVTGAESPVFDQAFYLGHPDVSSFHARCLDELGYSVGELSEAGEHRIAYVPSEDVKTLNWRDPLDY